MAEDWADRGYSCDEFRDPPGREWNDFVHETNELVMVVEGRLRVTMEGQTAVLEPGDELFIPKRVTHSVKNVHAGVTRWLYGYD
ncbi:MAG: cupin domain-containing protein [Nitrospirota bacterium]